MQGEEKIFTYLQNIALGIDNLKQENKVIIQRIDIVEKSLSEKIEFLDRKIEILDRKIEILDRKIDAVEKSLSESIENSHEALLGLIIHNKENIELLLIPLNDRNFYIRGDADKISDIERRLEEVETVVGNHSEAIRRLSYA